MPKRRRGRKPAEPQTTPKPTPKPKTKRSPRRSTTSKKNADPDPQLEAIPEPPEDLGPYGQNYWRQHAGMLIEQGILTPVHLQTFRVLCEQWQTYRTMSVYLDQNPGRWTFVTETGYEQETPQVRFRDNALKQLLALWLKFGLTPHALATLNKQRGTKGPSQVPAIAQFAKKKYDTDAI